MKKQRAMRRAPNEQCDYVFEVSAADCYAVFRKNNKVKKSNITGCSAVGSAPALGAGCRGFESLHSDQNFDRKRKKISAFGHFYIFLIEKPILKFKAALIYVFI